MSDKGKSDKKTYIINSEIFEQGLHILKVYQGELLANLEIAELEEDAEWVEGLTQQIAAVELACDHFVASIKGGDSLISKKRLIH